MLCVHYRCVRFGYYIGDQFIEPYDSSGSLPLLSHYVGLYNCSLSYVAENKLVVVVGSTYTAEALRYVRTEMLTSAAGDRSDARNVVVVMTDGNSGDKPATKVYTCIRNEKVGKKSFLISETVLNLCFLRPCTLHYITMRVA